MATHIKQIIWNTACYAPVTWEHAFYSIPYQIWRSKCFFFSLRKSKNQTKCICVYAEQSSVPNLASVSLGGMCAWKSFLGWWHWNRKWSLGDVWVWNLDIWSWSVKGCFELFARWRPEGSVLLLNDGLVLAVGLGRIYRITLLFGEHGCRDSGQSTEQEESRQISITVRSPNMNRKEPFPLKLAFLGDEFTWGSWHAGVTEVKATYHFLPTLFAVGIFRGHRDGFAVGGRFCRAACGLLVGEEHILPTSARWAFWLSFYE